MCSIRSGLWQLCNSLHSLSQLSWLLLGWDALITGHQPVHAHLCGSPNAGPQNSPLRPTLSSNTHHAVASSHRLKGKQPVRGWYTPAQLVTPSHPQKRAPHPVMCASRQCCCLQTPRDRSRKLATILLPPLPTPNPAPSDRTCRVYCYLLLRLVLLLFDHLFGCTAAHKPEGSKLRICSFWLLLSCRGKVTSNLIMRFPRCPGCRLRGMPSPLQQQRQNHHDSQHSFSRPYMRCRASGKQAHASPPHKPPQPAPASHPKQTQAAPDTAHDVLTHCSRSWGMPATQGTSQPI